MSVAIESKLYVGAYFDEINIDEEELQELCYEEVVNCFFPDYDVPFKWCCFGVEITPEFIMEDGGIDKVKALITEMNELFKTDKSRLNHTPYVY
jgi:hypothetical protein